MIFSLLNVRKKTAAALAGIAIAALSLWGVAMWQNVSLAELFTILLATVVMLGTIIVLALLIIAVFKLLSAALKKLTGSKKAED
ncbi:MAG: hypothetical protein O2971_15965 [Proteobacteria bacterium]|nr:hypothetical protein [Pseudomonadota bacterium]